jgi:hypothetical protein
MARNPHIKPQQVEAIANAIHSWDRGSINWDAIRKLAKPILGFLPSRSGLSSHADIQAAFSARKANLGLKPAGRAPSPGSLADASRIIASRDNEIATYKQQVDAFREKFDRWRYNALLLNIKIDRLDQPLPAINRSQ